MHAGVDWDWQMPAVSLPFAALGGLALGRPGWRDAARDDVRLAAGLRSAGAVVVGACVLPALVLASQVRLNEATAAYASGDCARADKLAQRSIDMLGTRAPPWQIEALCSVRGRPVRTRRRRELRARPGAGPRRLAAAGGARGGHGRRAAPTPAPRRPPRCGSTRSIRDVRALAQALAGGPSAKARRAARRSCPHNR